MTAIAVVLFEGAEELDFAGPWEVLAAWATQRKAPDLLPMSILSQSVAENGNKSVPILQQLPRGTPGPARAF